MSRSKWAGSRLLSYLAVLGFAFGSAALIAPGSVSAQEGCDDPGPALLPNLANMTPTHVHVQEGQKENQLLFTVGLVNLGPGPLELEPVGALDDPKTLVDANQNIWDSVSRLDDGGCIVSTVSLSAIFDFHEEHNHWHLTGSNSFGVFKAKDDGSGGAIDFKSPIGAPVKQTFCLLSYVPLNDEQLLQYDIPELPRRFYFDCFGIQGVDVGWIDYYHHSTHEQQVDLPLSTPPGIYYLVLEANRRNALGSLTKGGKLAAAQRVFLETDYTDNVAWVSFELTYQGKHNAIATPLFDSYTELGIGVAPPSNRNP